MNPVNKSRNISINQLFEILQQEYIVCEIRSKIYPVTVTTKEKIVDGNLVSSQIVEHQKYWKDLMQKKKQKILDISQRNHLFSIFDDKRVKSDFDKKIIPEMGYPNFIYKDDRQRLLQEKWDRHNYYSPKSEVKVYDQEGKIVIGYIETVDFAKGIVRINIDSLIKEFNIETVTRIL